MIPCMYIIWMDVDRWKDLQEITQSFQKLKLYFSNSVSLYGKELPFCLKLINVVNSYNQCSYVIYVILVYYIIQATPKTYLSLNEVK